MFLLRSAFWLTVAFLVVAPPGTDFGAAATTLKDQAISAGLEAGEQLIAEQVVERVFDPKRLPDILLSSTQSVALPMQNSSTMLAVFPRHRPAALG